MSNTAGKSGFDFRQKIKDNFQIEGY